MPRARAERGQRHARARARHPAPALLSEDPCRPSFDLAWTFADLNRDWIERLFALEDADLKVLRDPQASIVGASTLFLLTNSRLEGAIRLYARLGFRHAPLPRATDYARADVYMERPLPAQSPGT